MKRILIFIFVIFPFITFSQVEILSVSPSFVAKGQSVFVLIKTSETRLDINYYSISFGNDIDVLSTQTITPTLISAEIKVKPTAIEGSWDLQLEYLNQYYSLDNAIQIIDGLAQMSVSLQLMPFEFLRISDFDPINAHDNPLIFNIVFSNDQAERNLKIRFLLTSLDYGELLLAEKGLATFMPGELLSISNRDFDDYFINGQADKFLRKSGETSYLPAGEYELIIAVLDELDGILITDEQSIYLDNKFPDIDLIGPGNSIDESPEKVSSGLLFFQWLSSGYSFDFKLVEVMSGQLAAEDIMTNYPVYTAEEIAVNYLNYPAFAELLEEGKTYAWQISSHYLGTLGLQSVQSEVFWFSIEETDKVFEQFESLKIIPDKLIIEPNNSCQFQILGVTKEGKEISLYGLWEVLPDKYAEINSKGVFTAGNYATPVQVKATYRNLTAEASVIISNRTPESEIDISALIDELFGLHLKNDLYLSLQSREYSDLEKNFSFNTNLFESIELDFSAEGPILWDVFSDYFLINPVSGLKTIGVIASDIDSIKRVGESYKGKIIVDYDITYAIPSKSKSIEITDSFACVGCNQDNDIDTFFVHHKLGRLSREVNVHSLWAEIVSIELQNDSLVCKASVYPEGGNIYWTLENESKSGKNVSFLQRDSLAERMIILSYEIENIYYRDTAIIAIDKYFAEGSQLNWKSILKPDTSLKKQIKYDGNQFIISEINELDDISVYCPRPGDTILNGELLIVCEVNPRIKLDPKSVQIFIASAEVSTEIKVHGHTISALFTTKIRPDIYDIEVRFRDENRQFYYKRWTFFIANPNKKKEKYRTSPKAELKKKPGFQGQLNASTKFTSLSGPDAYLRQEPDQLHQLRFTGKIAYKKFDVPLKLYLTNQESSFRPYRNRFMTGIETKSFKLHVGDLNPYFHKQIMYGQSIRGINVSYKYRGMEITYSRGEVARSVEGAHDTFTLGQGFPPGNLQSDSTYISDGIYQRDISVLNLKFTSIDNTKFNIVLLKSTDDTNSINYGGYANQNFVFGVTNQVKSRNNVFTADFGVALSVTTDDIRKGIYSKAQIDELFSSDIPFYPENLKWMIILNSTTKPLNWNNRPPLALYGKAKLNILRQRFYFKFDRIGSTYYSFGNPYLINDRIKYSIEDRFAFWKKKIKMSIAYTSYANNLSEIESITKTTQIAKAKMNLNISSKWPVFLFSYRYYLRDEWLTKTLQKYQSSGIKNATAGANYRFTTGSVKHNIGLFYNYYLRQFSKLSISDQSTQSFNFNISEQFPYNIGLSAYYQSFVQTIDTADLGIQYTLGVRLNWKSNNSKIRLALSSNTIRIEPTLFSAKSFRQLHKVELTYRLVKNMELTADVGYGSFELSSITSRFYKEFWGMLRLNYNIR